MILSCDLGIAYFQTNPLVVINSSTLAVIGVGRRVKPLKPGYFQGQTVHLPEGKSYAIYGFALKCGLPQQLHHWILGLWIYL
jgi:hypothetical protein